MSAKPFPWFIVAVAALVLVGVGFIVLLVIVALQPPAPVHAIPDDPLPPLEARGRSVFKARGCIACHSVDGSDGIGPSMAAFWGSERKLHDGGSVIADEAHFRESIRQPLAKVTAGYRPAMPGFGNSIAEGDMTALMAYIRTLQPKHPTEARDSASVQPDPA